MNDYLRDKLCELLAAHGRPLIDDRPRCEALLWLAAGENSHGMFALIGALERKVPQAILTAPPEHRDAELQEKLARRLMADLDMDETAARWAVASWAQAILGAPAQPLAPNEPHEPVLPTLIVPKAKPALQAPAEFASLPSLTLDDEPTPAPVLRSQAALLNLDNFFTGHTAEDSFLQGGAEGVHCLAYSPDGLTLATGHDDGTVKLWDADTGQQRGVLGSHTGCVRAVAFAPHGRQLASASADGTVKLWQTATQYMEATLDGHDGAVTCLAYSPDSSTLVTGGSDGTVRLWHADRGTFRRTLRGHSDEVTCLAYSPDGRTIASGSLDRTVKLWDVGFGTFWAILKGHADGVTSLAYAPEGDMVVTGSRDQTVRLWNAVTAREIARFAGQRDGHTRAVNCLAFAPNGWTVASGGWDEVVRIWDVTEWREVCCFPGHAGPIRALAYTPDGYWLTSAGADGTVRRWRAPDADRPARMRRPFGKRARSSRSTGKTVAWSVALVIIALLLVRLVGFFWSRSRQQPWNQFAQPNNGFPQFDPPAADPWPANPNFPEQVLPGHQDVITAVALAGNDHTALSGSFDKSVRLWDLNQALELRRFDGHTGPVLTVALSPDGRRALSGSLDKTVRLWDVQNGRELHQFGPFGSGVTCVTFSPDGKRFAASCGFARVVHKMNNIPGQLPKGNMEWHRPPFRDASVTVWETESGRQLRRLVGHDDEVTAVAFTPDGQRVVSGSFDKTLILWDLRTGKMIRRFRGHTGEVFSVAVSADGRHVLSSSGTLSNIPNKNAQNKAPQQPPVPVAVVPDNTVRLWDLETGLQLRILGGYDKAVTAVAFSPDGQRIVSAGFDARVRVWETRTGFELREYNADTTAVNAVAVTSDGQRLLSGGWDTNLRVWRMPP